MTVRYRLSTMLVFAVLATAAPASAQAPRLYRAEDLGSFGGPYLVGVAINNHGDVAGYAYLTDGTIHAFRWTASSGLEDLGANGGWLSQAAGINDNGDVVGVFLDAANEPHGFVAPRGGVMRDLRTPQRQIVRVNSITNDGRMTGMLYSFTPSFQVHAFRTLLDGTLEDLGNTVYASDGWHINAKGEVTGYEAHSAAGTEQSAFRFSDGLGKLDLGTAGGARSSGIAINDSSVVVGWSEGATADTWSRAFRAAPGSPMEDLGTLGGLTAGAESINDAGDVVGWASGQYFMTAFVYADAYRDDRPQHARGAGCRQPRDVRRRRDQRRRANRGPLLHGHRNGHRSSQSDRRHDAAGDHIGDRVRRHADATGRDDETGDDRGDGDRRSRSRAGVRDRRREQQRATDVRDRSRHPDHRKSDTVASRVAAGLRHRPDLHDDDSLHRRLRERSDHASARPCPPRQPVRLSATTDRRPTGSPVGTIARVRAGRTTKG